MRRLALVPLLLLAGCGGDRAPSSVVPADATIYVGVAAADAELIVTRLSRTDVDFDRDVRPWLGDRAAYFATRAPDDGGLVLDSEDDEAAEAFARKVTAAGPYRASAVIDGRLVLTSTPALLRAVDASAGGEALADSARLDVSGEDDEDILIATSEPRALLSAFELLEMLPPRAIPAEALGDGPLTARIRRERAHSWVEVTGLPRRSDSAPTLANVPGAAWLAASSADLGEDATHARAHEQYQQIEDLTGLDLERTILPHLGAGMFFVQGRGPYDMGGRLVAEAGDEEALRREAIALARRLGPRRADLNLERPGAEERFLELSVATRDIAYFVRIREGRLYLDVGTDPGGVAEDLDDTAAYRDAQQRLGGAPTFLLVSGEAYLAARDATEDGRRVLRLVQTS